MNLFRPPGLAVRPRRSAPLLRVLLPTAMLVSVLVSGCGGGKSDAAGGEVAARVNNDAISVAHVAAVLQQQRGLRPDQADAAGRQVLERLIDQQLVVQKAQELKLDTDPKLARQFEIARGEVLARAYVEKVGETAVKPTPEAIKQYYDEKPALFKERRLYNIQELAIEARPEQVEALRNELKSAPNINAFVEYLKAQSMRFAANQAVRPAEQVPLALLDALAKLKDGQAVLMPTPTGAQVIVLAGSRLEPVDEARARPVIEQFLLTDAKRKLVEADLKALRSAAKIEYPARPAAAAAASAGSASAAAAAPAAPASK